MKCKHRVGHVCDNMLAAYGQMECPFDLCQDMCKDYEEKARPRAPKIIEKYLKACGKNKELCNERCPWHLEYETIKEDAAKAICNLEELRTACAFMTDMMVSLSEKKHRKWRKTSEQMPSEDEGKILVRCRDGTILESSGRILRAYESYSHKAAEKYPFWFPAPELPEGECL